MKVQVKNKQHRRFENGEPKVYRIGEVFDASEAEVKAFGDKLEVVQEEKPANTESTEKKAKEKAKKEKTPEKAPEVPADESGEPLGEGA